MAYDVLIVDDEKDIRDLMAGILSDEGYLPRLAHDSISTFEEIKNRQPALILLDIWLQGSPSDGLEILEEIKNKYTDIPVIMISGHGNIETAVSAIRSGAFDYIEKPFKMDKLLLTVQHAIESRRLNREIRDLKRKAGITDRLIGGSPLIEKLNTSLQKVAPSNGRVLLTGPRGSGKEIAARIIHAHSLRAHMPFTLYSTPHYNSDLLSELLFGTEEGKTYQIGLLEESHGGSIYIDEIDQWDMALQQKFLRFLIDNEFTRVGGSQPVKVNVRVLAGSSSDLNTKVKKGAFLSDLLHRLNVVHLVIPSLTERREDIPSLVDNFIGLVANQFNMRTLSIDNETMAIIQSHNWTGNVRQLRNCIEHMMINANDKGLEKLSSDLLPNELFSDNSKLASPAAGRIVALPLRDAREVFEREYLVAQIERFGGNISRTAEFVGMERSALHRKLKSLGVQAIERNGS
mgnify:CR=1 FL=1